MSCSSCLYYFREQNPNFFPTVILLGALLVPVSFIAYVYDQIPAKEISLSCILTCFLGGGAVGLIAAGLLEFQTIQYMGIPMLFMVGLVAESAKLIFSMCTLIQSGGNVKALEQVLLIRGLLSPAGHAAWTGFVCAMMWRERERPLSPPESISGWQKSQNRPR